MPGDDSGLPDDATAEAEAVSSQGALGSGALGSMGSKLAELRALTMPFPGSPEPADADRWIASGGRTR